MTDTPETLKAALADLTARVAAFEKSPVENMEPPRLTDMELNLLYDGPASTDAQATAEIKAVNEIRYLRRELARLREGLKVQEDDMPDNDVSGYADRPEKEAWCEAQYYRNVCVDMAKEIKRHRALLKDGGGK